MRDMPGPYDQTAEAMLLGNCIHAANPEPISGLTPDFFYSGSNERIAREILEMASLGEPITLLGLAERLRDKVPIEHLSALPDGIPIFDRNILTHYRRRVIEAHNCRQGAKLANALKEAYLRGDSGLIRNCHERLAAHVTSQEADASRATLIELVDSSDFMKRASTDERPYLIEGLIPPFSHTNWQGRPKAGKSHTLLQVAFDASAGLPVFGRFEVREPVRVAYVELEEPESETKRRLAAMLRAHDGKGPEAGQLRFFSREDLYRLRLLPHELLGTKLEVFAESLRSFQVDLLILIALRKLLRPGQSLNDQETAEQLNSGLSTLRQLAKLAVITGHHDRKSVAATVEAQGFGSTMLSAEADGVFDIRRRGDGLRDVSFEGRYQIEEDRFCLELSKKGEGEIIAHTTWRREDDARKAELRRRVKGGEPVYRAAKALRIPKTTAYNRTGSD